MPDIVAPSLFESSPWFGIRRPWNEALSDVFAWREIKFQKRCIAAASAAPHHQ
jgi:hypothetical protein